jgi:hypothetical protein
MTDDEMIFDVINGSYNLHIVKCEIPKELSGYNKKMEWFKETYLK